MRIKLENHGTIVLVRPIDEEAAEWLKGNVAEDAQWFGPALAVEPRYVGDLVQGFKDDGGELAPW